MPRRGPIAGTMPSINNTLRLPCGVAGSVCLVLRAAAVETDYYHAAQHGCGPQLCDGAVVVVCFTVV